MAFTISTATFSAGSLGLSDAIEEIRGRVRVNEPESLRDAAPFLYALGRNRRFLIDALLMEIQKGGVIQTTGLQDTSLVLYQDARILVRANFWFPYNGFPAAHASRVDSLGYLIPHNHDFHFLTLGYWGPGYRTTIYECDIGSKALLSPGDSVDLVFSETTALQQGKLMLYRAIQDVHFQEHPSNFSISLNIVLLPQHQFLGQHLFDIASRSVRAVLDHSRSQILACELAAGLGDPSLLENLRDLHTNSKDHRVAAAAHSALATILSRKDIHETVERSASVIISS